MSKTKETVGKDFVKVLVQRPAKPVKFKKGALSIFPNLDEISEHEFTFNLTLVSSANDSAYSFILADIEGTIEPILDVELFNNKTDKERLKRALRVPTVLFNDFESNILKFEGSYTEAEIQQIVEKWYQTTN